MRADWARSQNTGTAPLCVNWDTSQHAGVTGSCVCVWKWPVSGGASDLYHQSSAGPGMFDRSSFPLCLFLSNCLFFHLSLNPSRFVALLLSGPLFHSSSPPSVTETLCNVDHRGPCSASQHIAHIRICIIFLSRLHTQSYRVCLSFSTSFWWYPDSVSVCAEQSRCSR